MASQPLDTSLQIASVGDFNGDGKADVLIQWSDGTLQTWDGSYNGAIQSPAEKQWWEAFVGMQALMGEMQAAEMSAAVQSVHNMVTPQTLDMSGEMAAAVGDMWYMSNPSMWPNAPNSGSLSDLVSQINAAGSGVHINLVDGGGLTATVGGNTVSLTPIDQGNGTFDFKIGGTDLIAHWSGGGSYAPPPEQNAIVINGTKPPDAALYLPSGLSVIYADNDFYPYNGFGGMAPLSAYLTFGVSLEANAFANAHVHNQGADGNSKDTQYAHAAYDYVAKLYEYAKAHPDTLLTIGDYSLTGSQVLNALSQEQLYITDSTDLNVIGPTGAQTGSMWNTTTGVYRGGTTYINPNDPKHRERLSRNERDGFRHCARNRTRARQFRVHIRGPSWWHCGRGRRQYCRTIHIESSGDAGPQQSAVGLHALSNNEGSTVILGMNTLSRCRRCAILLGAAILVCPSQGVAKGQFSTRSLPCLSQRHRQSGIGRFFLDIWPPLARRSDVLVNTTLSLPRDLTKPAKPTGSHLGLEPPAVNSRSAIWTESWGAGERPSAHLVQRWISAQQPQRIVCGKHDKFRWGIRVVNSAEADALTRWSSNAPQSATRAIRIGVPAFSRSGRLALLRYMVSGPGLSGEDMLLLYRQDAGHWRQVGQATLAQF